MNVTTDQPSTSGAKAGKRRAWRVLCADIECVCADDTREQARMRAFRSAEECGFRPKWNQTKAWRAAEFDEWADVATFRGPCNLGDVRAAIIRPLANEGTVTNA